MDFAGIGKISAFAKQKNLLYAANYRLKTGQRLTDANGNINFSKASMFSSTQSSKANSNSASDKAKLAAIKSKLKSGKKLSASEMNYLREKDAKLYKKAKYAQDAREQLETELKQATTKAEAREAVMRAMARIAADCSADLSELNGSGGGGDFGGSMNFGGDFSAGTNGGESVSVGENISTGSENISTAENVSAGENISTAENVSSNENTVAQNSSSTSDDSESAIDILDKYIYAIRAVQDEWAQFIKSDRYKHMPEDIFEAADMKRSRSEKISHGQVVDAILAYKKSMSYELEV